MAIFYPTLQNLFLFYTSILGNMEVINVSTFLFEEFAQHADLVFYILIEFNDWIKMTLTTVSKYEE